MNKTIYFFMLFAFASIALADNATVTYLNNTEINSNENITINHTQDNSYDNGSIFVYPVSCLFDSSYCSNNTGRCEIERTLNFGETYLRDDQFCNLEMSCPECGCEDVENVTHKIRWKLRTDDDNIYITYLNENVTRSYSKSDNFNFETEYDVACPDIGNQKCEDTDFLPFNITEDQFSYYCLRPFGEYGQRLYDITNSMVAAFEKKEINCHDLQKSNELLAEFKGQYEERLKHMEEKALQLNNCSVTLRNNNNEMIDLRRSIAESEASHKAKNVTITLLVVVMFIVGSFYIMERMEKKLKKEVA